MDVGEVTKAPGSPAETSHRRRHAETQASE